MKCANCGLPLSPSRTHCPRCGAAKGSPVPASAVQGPSSLQQGESSPGAVQIGWEVARQARGAAATSSTWNVQGGPSFAQHLAPAVFQASDEQLPFPLAGSPFVPSSRAETLITPQEGLQEPVSGSPEQLWFPPLPAQAVQAPLQTPEWAKVAQGAQGPKIGQLAQEANGAQARSDNDGLAKLQGVLLRILLASEEEPRTVQPGFSIAGLCVMVGGLMLVFVHFMALSLVPATPQSVVEPRQLVSNTVTPVVTVSVSPTSTPTPEFPGQQYIDSAQMASAVSGGLPTQVTTDFKVGQQINVTFMVHPAGHSGAVCLLWYLNNQQITHYEFLVAAYNTARPASSYAILGGSGTGAVELYWASAIACQDKQLAQRLTFNVS